jgi:Asp-tRNA(Asn)/Glu-tRNA(Gln) amidotransferase A subunit family amidase
MSHDDELCDLSAVELRRRIAAKDVSPVELLQSCHRRIDAVNPAVNAVVAEDRDAALDAARAAEQAVVDGAALAPLHGLPIGVKDLNETAGLATTFGSPLYADHVPQKDDAFVARLRGAGGVIAAKTNTPEFGAGANTTNSVYGTTGSPFLPARTCGGSSGGSAVVLATSMLPLAAGSDLGGSLRTPAAYCGVVGMRPTPGVVATARKEMAWSPLWTEGPMARSVADLALFLEGIAGGDPRDPLSGFVDGSAFAGLQPRKLKGLRLSISEDLGFAPVSSQVRDLFRDRVERLSALVDCVPADPPLSDAALDPNRCFEVLRAVGFLGKAKKLMEQHPDKVGPNVSANVKLGLGFSAADVAAAEGAQTRLYHRFLAFMEGYDALVCPVASVQPFDKTELFPREIDGKPLPTYISCIAITYGLTLVGHPVLVLPCGLDGVGLPFGLQIVGRRGGDAELLRLGLALEEAFSGSAVLRRPLPDLGALAAAS